MEEDEKDLNSSDDNLIIDESSYVNNPKSILSDKYLCDFPIEGIKDQLTNQSDLTSPVIQNKPSQPSLGKTKEFALDDKEKGPSNVKEEIESQEHPESQECPEFHLNMEITGDYNKNSIAFNEVFIKEDLEEAQENLSDVNETLAEADEHHNEALTEVVKVDVDDTTAIKAESLQDNKQNDAIETMDLALEDFVKAGLYTLRPLP